MDAILCGSRAGAQEAQSQLGLPAERVTAVTTGADHWLRDAKPMDAQSLERAGPQQLLVLGSLNESRRPLEVLAAFEALRASNPTDRITLVFCGRPGNRATAFREALTASPVREDVTWIDAPVEADLPQLVASSTALIHLSVGELSPITPLEAMTFGAAVVASDLPAFREVLAEAPGAFLVPNESGSDPAELGKLIESALASGLDPAARKERLSIAANHTWRANAVQTLELWKGLV
jgi:phosphatidylinositol alpha-mannosyltransferase